MAKEVIAFQPHAPEGYTPDPELGEVVKRLPGYLQPVVTLMATMVPPTEENRLREKRGREALDQGVSMVLLVSALVSLYFYQVAVARDPDNIFPLLFRTRWPWFRRTKTMIGL